MPVFALRTSSGESRVGWNAIDGRGEQQKQSWAFWLRAGAGPLALKDWGPCAGAGLRGNMEPAEAEVTLEDQQNINSFGRLDNRLHELDDRIRQNKVGAPDASP